MSNEIVKPDGGFPLPEEINPPRICVMLQIPDDPQHIRAFWGALFELTRWFNWQRDAEHTAKPVADVWLEVFLQSHENYLESCMIDPCCPETNEILEAIRVLNLTIVNNQITMIDNDTTIINQNEQVTSNQYLTQYQSFITNNQNINQFNEMIYDGDYHSIAPELGTDFGGTSATDAALCAAIKSYINTLIYVFGMQAAALSALAGVIVGIGLALVPLTLGTSLIGVAAAGAITASAALWDALIKDPEAQRKVICCMFDALKDVPISQAAFQTSCTSCDLGGVYESNEGFLAAQISACNGLEENWLAFVRALGQSQGGGNAADCACDCEDDIVLESGNGSTITPLGNCIYRFVGVVEGDFYYTEFNDILNRCLHVENSPDPTYGTGGVGHDTNVTDCDGVVIPPFVGGFTPGDLRSVRFMGNLDNINHFKITLAE